MNAGREACDFPHPKECTMKLKSTLLALSVSASLLSHSASAERVGTGSPESDLRPVSTESADLSFATEQQFLEKFGHLATRVADGSYRIERHDKTLDVRFGKPALESLKRQLEPQIASLRKIRADDLTIDQAGDLARMEQRHKQLTQRISGFQAKAMDSADQCGFKVDLYAFASRSSSSGSAQAYAPVSAGTGYGGFKHAWHAVIDVNATVAFPDLAGGLSARYDDNDWVDTYSTSVNTPNASVYAPGFYICARASAFVEVIRDSGNPWFPNYCANPVSIVETSNDPECPQYY
jgi:hypothetical protein